jgi:hypothetical protein
LQTNGTQKNGKQHRNKIMTDIHVQSPQSNLVLVGPACAQNGQVKVTGTDPKSCLGIKLVDALIVAGVLAEGVGFAAVVGFAAPPLEFPDGTNSVTVTSLPSAYFVVTVFATIPCGTARLGGCWGGTESFETAYAATIGMLSLSGGADGAASSSFTVTVGGMVWGVVCPNDKAC